MKIKRPWTFDANATYVIAGGLGGIGRSTANWMAQRGAKNLILLSRLGVSNDEARGLVRGLHRQGVRVEVPRCDIAVYGSLKHTLDALQSQMPPIKGCIQSAMVLRVSFHYKSPCSVVYMLIIHPSDRTRYLET